MHALPALQMEQDAMPLMASGACSAEDGDQPDEVASKDQQSRAIVPEDHCIADGEATATSVEHSTTTGSGAFPTRDSHVVEESEAVQMLDRELAELGELLVLQQRKVEALERLRGQYLSGER